ncbi:MAG: cupin domain-containing protein, partial [Bacteroidetes bacterium]|nr:cupin domain-containing protein [Bacteroidota bacterium]
MSADFWIEKLKLEKHPEGGAFREIYRSPVKAGLPMCDGAISNRNLSTGIYYLLQAGEFSAFHRIRSDEIWHHYDGGDLMIYVLHPDIGLEIKYLGKNHPDAELQLCVP